ncbi:hypothetical protein M9H77_19139 [Catharanthus roseus]|uniref:Uncharacterized protein n=1 Tax=Catharanthus roseus TaxID=4058 RepID=A0ACC0B9F4_CATRO|nr:hypothetical protein M9H77_19139 [Catharanthus roseus]
MAPAAAESSIKPRDTLLKGNLVNNKLKPEDSSNSFTPQTDVCIVGVACTPMGGFLGTLSSLSATKLGSIAIESKITTVFQSMVPRFYFFVHACNVCLLQGKLHWVQEYPILFSCTTINKVCASGMKATVLAAQSIQLGVNDIVLAGGMESMSNVPKYIADARKGSRLGHDTLVDGMMKDGLWDVYNDCRMGVCAEICAEQHGITREDQSMYLWCLMCQSISLHASLTQLSFKETGGTVTAGNASSISDGAAAPVLVSGETVAKLGLAPELFTTAPALAIPKAVSNAGLEASQVDHYEINEAFSVVALANQKLLRLNPVSFRPWWFMCVGSGLEIFNVLHLYSLVKKDTQRPWLKYLKSDRLHASLICTLTQTVNNVDGRSTNTGASGDDLVLAVEDLSSLGTSTLDGIGISHECTSKIQQIVISVQLDQPAGLNRQMMGPPSSPSQIVSFAKKVQTIIEGAWYLLAVPWVALHLSTIFSRHFQYSHRVAVPGSPYRTRVFMELRGRL